MSSIQKSCLIIGGGMAGLLAAEKLAARGVEVVILDKGRGVGGRMATRYFHDGIFDHGAQFLTARTRPFKERVKEWSERGLLKEWTLPQRENTFGSEPAEAPHYCGVSGMNVVPRYLARKLRVQSRETVVSLQVTEHGWQAFTKEGNRYEGGTLIMTPPVPQSLAILEASGIPLRDEERAALQRIEYDPCIAVLALLDGLSRVPLPGGLTLDEGQVRWISDNHVKGISPEAQALTLLASPEFSRNHLEADLVLPAEELLATAAQWIGTAIRDFQVHRWRYAFPRTLHDMPFLSASAPSPLVFAGDAFAAPNLEGAALSGLAAADHLWREHLNTDRIQAPWIAGTLASDGKGWSPRAS